VQVVAGKVLTSPAQVVSLALGVFVRCAAMRFSKKVQLEPYLTVVGASTSAQHDLQEDIIFS
jgi:hypothetical protein